MKVSIIGIDLAKNVFQVAGLNAANKVVFNRRLSRAKLAPFMAQQPPTVVAMEVTGAAHYWGRVLRRRGHEVRLIPPQHVKAFCRIHKSDAHDVIAICEAARRPDLHPVPIKSIPRQDLGLLESQRQRLTRQRSAVINQARGVAREYGVFFPKGRARVMDQLPEVLESADHELSAIARSVLWSLYQEAGTLDERLAETERQLEELAAPIAAYQRLRAIPGYGPVISVAFLAAGAGGNQFRNGRQCAAWLGLVPRQHGSGEVNRNLGITKNGNRSLRALLIHGARTVVRWALARQREDALGRWVRRLHARRGAAVTIVALANKMARIGWAVVNRDEDFDMNQAFGG